jgi:hypothetical protein
MALVIALFWIVSFSGRTEAASLADLTGDWIVQEEERSYTATLDAEGNGTYTWQNGRIRTISLIDGKWEGLWSQSGNDREGGFELMISDDHTEASGSWWYTRVGQQNIPPREWTGPFHWPRVQADRPGAGNR